MSRALSVVVALVFSPLTAWSQSPDFESGLDLTTTGDLSSVMVVPPIVRVTQSQGGAFAGLNTAKTVERFDPQAHKRLVNAFEKQLQGKVIPAEIAMGVVTKLALTPGQVRSAAGLVKLAQATKVGWLVTFEINKTGTLVGSLFDTDGTPVGEPSYVTQAAGITQKHADDMAGFVSKQLLTLVKAKQDAEEKARAEAEAARAAEAARQPQVMAPPEDDVGAEIAARRKARQGFKPDPDKARVVVAVGPGAVVRDFGVSGPGANLLAELKNNAVVGFGFFARASPLQWFAATSGKRFAGLDLEVHYRRSLTVAQGQGPGVDGQRCSMVDDDLMVRASYGVKVAEAAWAPTVGAGVSFSQEQTLFTCSFPLASTTWRGADAQVRVKQPLYKSVLSLDAAFGPRFLFNNAQAQTLVSLAGEAWLELKPASVFFARGGARFSRMVGSAQGLTLTDTHLFFALELGAFL